MVAESTQLLGQQAQAVVMVFLGIAGAAFLGVLNSFIGRRLYYARWPWQWIWTRTSKGLANESRRRCWHFGLFDRLEGLTPWRAVVREFRSELLPYCALLDPTDGVPPPEFYQTVGRWVRDLSGNWEETPTRYRNASDARSDLVKAWVLRRVGVERGIALTAWTHADRFRQLGEAYVSLSTAVPSASLIVGLPYLWGLVFPRGGNLETWFAISTFAIALAVLGFLAYWRCHVEALRNWFQWQNELTRLFYVAYADEMHDGRCAFPLAK